MHDEEFELKRLRNQMLDAQAKLAQRQRSASRFGSQELTGQVVDGGDLPIQGMRYFLVNPVTGWAPVKEGDPPSPTVNTARKVPVAVLGPCVPQVGDVIVARALSPSGRWVSQHFCKTSLCVVLTQCGQVNLALSATVTVNDSKGRPAASCSVSGGLVSLSLVSGGSGYTDGTDYSLVFSGGGGVAAPAGTFDVVAGVVQNVQIVGRGQALTGTPTVSLPAAAGSGSGASITATVGSICCMQIGYADTFTGTATSGPYSVAIPPTTVNDDDSLMINADLPGPAKVTVNLVNAFCADVRGFVASITAHGPNGYTQTQNVTTGNVTTGIVFPGLPYAGSYTFTFAILANIQPIPPQTITINLCDNVSISATVYGTLTTTGSVWVKCCPPLPGGVGPHGGNVTGAPVTISNVGDAPTAFITGTTGSDGIFRFPGGLYTNCQYLFTADPPGTCGGWSAADSATTGPGGVLLGLNIASGWGCAGSRDNALFPPTVTLSGPIGGLTLSLVNPLPGGISDAYYTGTITVAVNVTGCVPPQYSASNAPGTVDMTVEYVPGQGINVFFYICGISGFGNPHNNVAFTGPTAPGSTLAGVFSTTNGPAVFCPLHDSATVSVADVGRGVTGDPTTGAGEPAYDQLLALLVGTYVITE